MCAWNPERFYKRCASRNSRDAHCARSRGAPNLHSSVQRLFPPGGSSVGFRRRHLKPHHSQFTFLIYLMLTNMIWVTLFCICVLVTTLQADARLSKSYVVGGCPSHCDKSMCPSMPKDCTTGQVMDHCNCCLVCASGEGEACGGVGKLGDPVCGESLECSVTGGVGFSATVRRRGKHGICVCKSSDPVCGSDGVSYQNVCELKRVSNRAQSLQQPPVLFIQRGGCGAGEYITKTNCTCLFKLFT